MVIIVALLVFMGCGSFIYYNTNVENKFLTDFQQEELQASYEKKYKKFENIPQPKITDVKLNVDIFPIPAWPARYGYFYTEKQKRK